MTFTKGGEVNRWTAEETARLLKLRKENPTLTLDALVEVIFLISSKFSTASLTLDNPAQIHPFPGRTTTAVQQHYRRLVREADSPDTRERCRRKTVERKNKTRTLNVRGPAARKTSTSRRNRTKTSAMGEKSKQDHEENDAANELGDEEDPNVAPRCSNKPSGARGARSRRSAFPSTATELAAHQDSSASTVNHDPGASQVPALRMIPSAWITQFVEEASKQLPLGSNPPDTSDAMTFASLKAENQSVKNRLDILETCFYQVATEKNHLEARLNAQMEEIAWMRQQFEDANGVVRWVQSLRVSEFMLPTGHTQVL